MMPETTSVEGSTWPCARKRCFHVAMSTQPQAKNAAPSSDERARREMLRGQQPQAVKDDPENTELDRAVNDERQHARGQEARAPGWSAAHFIPAEKNGSRRIAAPRQRKIRLLSAVRARMTSQTTRNCDGRQHMMPVMLGVVGGGESAQAEQAADERGGRGDRAVNGGALHQGSDHAQVLAGGSRGRSSHYFVLQSLDAGNRLFSRPTSGWRWWKSQKPTPWKIMFGAQMINSG